MMNVKGYTSVGRKGLAKVMLKYNVLKLENPTPIHAFDQNENNMCTKSVAKAL